MRIERSGKVEPLTPRIVRFLTEALGGVALDDVQSHEETRIDYACLRGLVGIELKTLEGDGHERLDNLTNDLRKRPDWPPFLGSAPMESFIKNTDDPDGIRKKVIQRVGRAIVTHLKKADDQLAAHAASYPRKNLVRLVVFVNEDHEIYDPQSVAYILWHQLRRQKDGVSRYANIDGVFYFTERHASIVEGRLAFPIVEIEGPSIQVALWKRDVTGHIAQAWARWNKYPLVNLDQQGPQFSTIDHIPEQGPLHEAWRLNYRRKPYMQGWTKDQLRARFDEVIYVNLLGFTHSSPARPPQNVTNLNMQYFAHMMVEMGVRGLPITEFSHSHDRIIAAARRLNATQEIIDWLEEMERERRLRPSA